MAMNKAELIMHPIRIRIIRALLLEPKTTQELAEQLPDVPKSSLYRHLKLLSEGELIGIAETNIVQGIQEKVYELVQMPRLSRAEMVEITADEHLRYFTTFMAILLQGFADYLETDPDFRSDMVGYNEVEVWASEEQFNDFTRKLNAAVMPLLRQEMGEGRRQYKVATVVFPVGNNE